MKEEASLMMETRGVGKERRREGGRRERRGEGDDGLGKSKTW